MKILQIPFVMICISCTKEQENTRSDELPDAPKPLYSEKIPDRDGIGKVFMGREISHIMGHQAAGWLERPMREREERSDLAVRALQLKPGDVVADIGCGTGYYSSRMARVMGDKGVIYGVEIQQEMLDLLAHYMDKLAITNVKG